MVLDGCGELGADVQERGCSVLAAPAARDLLLQFDHSDVAFGLVIVERDPEIGGESQDIVLIDVEAPEQCAGQSPAGPALFPGAWGFGM